MASIEKAVQKLGNKVVSKIPWYILHKAAGDSSEILGVLMKPNFWQSYFSFAKACDRKTLNYYLMSDFAVEGEEEGKFALKLYGIHAKGKIFSELAKLIAYGISDTLYWDDRFSEELVLSRESSAKSMFAESLEKVSEVKFTFGCKADSLDIKESKASAKIVLDIFCKDYSFAQDGGR